MFRSQVTKLVTILALVLALVGVFGMNTQNASAHSNTLKSTQATNSCYYSLISQGSLYRTVQLDECYTKLMISNYQGAAIVGGFIGLGLSPWFAGSFASAISGYAWYIQRIDDKCSDQGINLFIALTSDRHVLWTFPYPRC